MGVVNGNDRPQWPAQAALIALLCTWFVQLTLANVETFTPDDGIQRTGEKKFGDKCERTEECGYGGSVCHATLKACQCIEELPVTNHLDKCGKAAFINESCFFHEQCESVSIQTECHDNHCVCKFEMTPYINSEGVAMCIARNTKPDDSKYVDPVMIGILCVMVLMFITICVVLRLFSKARWREDENRTIFNTPNPRLMNASLLRESKMSHDRRGSRGSIRGPSRAPSMVSLRPHSPNNSQGSQARASRTSSVASSMKSPPPHHKQTHHHPASPDTVQG